MEWTQGIRTAIALMEEHLLMTEYHIDEIAMGANIEYYSQGDSSSPDYESAIWLPVKKR